MASAARSASAIFSRLSGRRYLQIQPDIFHVRRSWPCCRFCVSCRWALEGQYARSGDFCNRPGKNGVILEHGQAVVDTVPHAAFLGALQHGFHFLSTLRAGCGFDGVRAACRSSGGRSAILHQGSSLPFRSWQSGGPFPMSENSGTSSRYSMGLFLQGFHEKAGAILPPASLGRSPASSGAADFR